MKKLFNLFAWVALLLVPVTLKAQVTCPDGATSCSITIRCYDSFGDGWTGNAINVYQGTTLRGTVTLAGGDEGVFTVMICSGDSVRFEWVDGGNYSYPDEASFDISNGNFDEIITNGVFSSLPLTVMAACASCQPVRDVEVSNISLTSAHLTWAYASEEHGDLTITLRDNTDSLSEPVVYTETGTELWLSGLAAGHSYTVSLQLVCGDDSSVAVVKNFNTRLCGEASGELKHRYVPLTTYYNYSYSQAVYPASVVGGMDSITGVKLRVVTPISSINPIVDIYLANTDKNMLTLDDYEPVGNLTLVKSNYTLNVSEEGWVEIPFNNAFALNGSNILLAVYNHTGTYSLSYLYWGTHEATSGNTVYWNNDDMFTPATVASSFGNTSTNVGDVIFVGECNLSCLAPNMILDSLTATEAHISWVPGLDETSWVLQYKPQADSVWTDAATVSASPYIIDNLTPNTDYSFRLGTICSDSDTNFAVVSGKTEEACGAPVSANVIDSTITVNTATLLIHDTIMNHTYRVILVAGSIYDTLPVQIDTIVPLTGLTPNTNYSFYVSTVCEDGSFTNPVTGNFRTHCVAVSLPWTEDFETITSFGPNKEPCWMYLKGIYSDSVVAVPTASSNWYLSNKGLSTGKNVKVNIYGTSCNYWLVTPEIDLSYNAELSFDVAFTKYNNSNPISEYSADDRFLVLISNDGAQTWSMLKAWTSDSAAVNFLPGIPATGTNVSIDLSTYTGGNVRIAFVGESTVVGGDNDLHIDNIMVAAVSSCQRPQGMRVDNININTADVHILDSNYVGNYIVNVYQNDSLISTIETNDTVYSLSNLTGSTAYKVVCRTICPAGDTTAASAPVNFVTDAVAVNPVDEFPYSANFSDTVDNASWVFFNYSTNAWYIGNAVGILDTVENPDDTISMGLYISNNNGTANIYSMNISTYSYACRDFTLAPGEYMFNFNWKGMGESNYDYLSVYLAPVTNLTPGTAVIPDASWFTLAGQLGQKNTWQDFESFIDIVNGGDYRLIFCWRNDGSMGTNPPAAIDNIKVNFITCPAPINFAIDTITANAIALHWQPKGAENAWEVVIGDNAPIVVNDTNYTATGLEPGTRYDIVVRAVCGIGDTSLPIGRTVSTYQIPATLPYSTGFEAGDDVAWQVTTLNNGSNEFAIGQAIAFDGTKSLYISRDKGITNTYNNNSHSVSFAYRLVNLAVGDYNFRYNWRCGGNVGNNTYGIGLIANSAFDIENTGNLGETMFMCSNTTGLSGGGNGWHEIDTTFTIDVAGNYYMLFYWRNDNTDSNYAPALAIDNVTLSKFSCAKPHNFVVDDAQASQITFHWSPVGTETSWEVRVGNNAPVVVTDTVYTATGLALVTNYDITVRAICAAGDTSIALTGSASTTQEPAALPYTTGFEAGDDTDWQFVSGTNAWYIGNATNNGGTSAMYISSDAGATNTYNISTTTASYAYRLFNVTAGDYYVSFDWKANGEGTTGSSHFDYLRAFIAPSSTTFIVNQTNGINSNTLPEGYIPLDGNAPLDLVTEWQTRTDTVSLTAGSYYLVFYWKNDHSSGNNPPAAIDNVNFMLSGDAPVACAAPTNLTAQNVTTTSASLSWTAGGDETEWDVNVNGMVSRVSTNPYTLTGLTAATNYTVRVRAVCSETDKSIWTDAFTFTTQDNNGIDDVMDESFALYPNPATNVVTIDLSNYNLSDANVCIIDLNGREVYKDAAKKTTTIDITNYARGTYFVRVTTNEGSAVRKLIVQ